MPSDSAKKKKKKQQGQEKSPGKGYAYESEEDSFTGDQSESPGSGGGNPPNPVGGPVNGSAVGPTSPTPTNAEEGSFSGINMSAEQMQQMISAEVAKVLNDKAIVDAIADNEKAARILQLEEELLASKAAESMKGGGSLSASEPRADPSAFIVQPVNITYEEHEKLVSDIMKLKDCKDTEGLSKEEIGKRVAELLPAVSTAHVKPTFVSLSASELAAFDAYSRRAIDEEKVAALFGAGGGYPLQPGTLPAVAIFYDNLGQGGVSWNDLVGGTLENSLASSGGTHGGGSSFKSIPGVDSNGAAEAETDECNQPLKPKHGSPWFGSNSPEPFSYDLRSLIHDKAAILAGNLSASLVNVSLATLRGIYRFAASQLLLLNFMVVVLSILSPSFSGLSDA